MVMFEGYHRMESVPLGNHKCLMKWLNIVLMWWSGSLVRCCRGVPGRLEIQHQVSKRIKSRVNYGF